jgi:hypothetical protein
MVDKMDANELIKRLQAPFTADEIEWRVGSTNKDKTKGLALAYVTNRAIQNRLDEVFGPFGWQNSFKEWKETSQICGISVYSEYHSAWITKWDGADDSQTEAVKGGLSDSMKRAAYQWGIGRYLYNLPQTWMNLKDGKYLAETPQLPKWALPDGFEYKGKHETPPQAPPKTEEPPKGNKNENKADNNTLKCAGCNSEINQAVHTFSTKKFGKPLCRACQSQNAPS